MLILNPRKSEVITKFDGAVYRFFPGETRDVSALVGKHILGRWGKYGLVDVTFNKDSASKYADYELFVHDMRIKGMQNYYETLLIKHQSFLQYDEECGTKKTVERLRYAQMARDTQTEINEIEKQINDLREFDTQELLDKKAKDLMEQAEKLKSQAASLRGNNHGRVKGQSENRAS